MIIREFNFREFKDKRNLKKYASQVLPTMVKMFSEGPRGKEVWELDLVPKTGTYNSYKTVIDSNGKKDVENIENYLEEDSLEELKDTLIASVHQWDSWDNPSYVIKFADDNHEYNTVRELENQISKRLAALEK